MSTIPADARPRLARGVKLAEDRVRGGWNVLAPERVLKANATTVEILKLCNGERTFEEIVAELAARFSADPSRIETDAWALLENLRNKRMVEL